MQAQGQADIEINFLNKTFSKYIRKNYPVMMYNHVETFRKSCCKMKTFTDRKLKLYCHVDVYT